MTQPSQTSIPNPIRVKCQVAVALPKRPNRICNAYTADTSAEDRSLLVDLANPKAQTHSQKPTIIDDADAAIPFMLQDLFRGKFMKDNRAGVAADPSRKPSSNRFGHPSSVCLRRVSRRANRFPQRLQRWFRALRCTCRICQSQSFNQLNLVTLTLSTCLSRSVFL